MKSVFALLLLCSLNGWAYIPPTKVILDKTSENAGSASYQIEKEVRFANPEIPPLKEVWYIENDHTMRLTVTGVPAAGSQPLKLTILYVNGVKYMMSGASREALKLPEETTERFFHFHRGENLVQALVGLQILSSAQGNLDLARLNRSQGVVNFGLGRPTEEGGKGSNPYIWIEQDAFVIRKIRFNDETELIANNYQVFPKGLNYPMVTHINWADQKVRANTLSVTMVKKFQPAVFQSSQLEDTKPFLQAFSKWNPVIEFYKRFR